MSSDFTNDENNPFLNFAQMFGGPQQDPWTNALNLAKQIASGNGTESNVDPVSRKNIENLTRVAELQISQVEGITPPKSIDLHCVTRSEWSAKSFETYRPFFERFGEAIGDVNSGVNTSNDDPLAAMMSQLISSLGPMMVATSAGSMLGHLALTTLGQYDLPIPRSENKTLVVLDNLDSFAESIDTPKDEVYLWILIREHLTHTIINIPHVRTRIESLLIDFASAFTPNADMIQDQFNDITSFEEIAQASSGFESPDAVLSMMRSPSHDLLVPQISALLAPVLGFVDHSMDVICKDLINSHSTISGSIDSRQGESSEANHFMSQLLGLDNISQIKSQGKLFIEGVLERSGQSGLNRLWADELDLPTPSEINAPGLWLERIGFGSEDGGVFEIPDDISGLEDL